MDSAARTATDVQAYWKRLFSDLESAGVLRGALSLTDERAGLLTAQVSVPLARIDPGPLALETLLLAAWSVVLSRHSSSADVVFLTSFDHDKPWLGLVRTSVTAKSTAATWLSDFDAMLKEAHDQGSIPAQYLAQAKEEGMSFRLPAFLIVPAGAKAFAPREQIEGPLMVVVRLDTMRVELHYDITRFDASEVQALADHLNTVLRAMVETPDRTIGTLPLLTEKERTQLLDQWNATMAPFAEDTCVHQFFEAQAAKTPDAVAVIFTVEKSRASLLRSPWRLAMAGWHLVRPPADALTTGI